MALRIRLARGGAKKHPFYRVVVAEASMPRDGRFVERVGSYNPMIEGDFDSRVSLKKERITHWLGCGAQPSDRVYKMLAKAKILPEKPWRETPQKSAPGEKMAERSKKKDSAKT